MIEVRGPHLEKHNEATLYPLCGMYTLISVMRCLLIVMKVAMTRSLITLSNLFLSPLSVQNDCNTVFVLLFSSADDAVTLACLTYFCVT